MPLSNVRWYLGRKKDGPFGKDFPVSEASTPYVTGSRKRDVERWTNVRGPIATGGRPIYSSWDVPISRINSQCVDLELIHWPTLKYFTFSTFFQETPKPIHFHYPKKFPAYLVHAPSSIPPPSPHPSTSRPSLASQLRPSPIPQPRESPIIISQQLQPVAISSGRREDQLPLLFPAAQVFQRREHWPVWVNREYSNMKNEGQDSVARMF
ncbi:hypothetical protein O181_030016 [Austropuccinia psidii MF-1]|uniref:Uncharacterized protein n=1 Tax=Austropuccinia psidii MF-1 TaxID=1389203 RepID=A0A9Q3H3V1_9BASI|nr:hypothetical protein [Austropuccinia psidii MF-1]